jgi:hypothetical protein
MSRNDEATRVFRHFLILLVRLSPRARRHTRG